jgi:MFS family permease
MIMGFGSVPAMAVPVLFGLMGLAAGITGPSRDLLVKRSTPDHATGRVYGVVYSGLDIGQAVVPLFVGALMDQGAYRSVWLALVLLQGVLILSAFGVGRVRPGRRRQRRQRRSGHKAGHRKSLRAPASANGPLPPQGAEPVVTSRLRSARRCACPADQADAGSGRCMRLINEWASAFRVSMV